MSPSLGFCTPNRDAGHRLGLLAFTLASAAAFGQSPAPAYVFRHIAGAPGGGGWTDGVGTAARFNDIRGLAADSAGNVYVVDAGNNSIRKIALDGSVTTVAGNPPLPGSADGAGSAARFNLPMAAAFDGNGNLIIADWANNTIRRLSPAGLVTTVAGTADSALNSAGNIDGNGTAARFWGPSGVAVDDGGQIFVTDSGNDAVRRISTGGLVSTLSLSGPPGWPTGAVWAPDNPFGLLSPYQVVWGEPTNYDSPIVIDRAGNLYVVDYQWVPHPEWGPTFYLILQIDPAGKVATVSQFPLITRVAGLTVDSSGRLLVASQDGLLQMDSAGKVTTWASVSGLSGSGLAMSATGECFVADTDQVLKISPQGSVRIAAGLSAVSGTADGAGSAARFSSPRWMAVNSGGIAYVTDDGGTTLRRIAPDGTVTTLAGQPGVHGLADGTGSAATFNEFSGLVVDGAGNLIVRDSDQLRRVTPDGVVSTLAGISPAPTGGGLAIDPSGNLYYSGHEGTTASIYKLTPAGSVTAVARASSYGGLAIDRAGNIYAEDAGVIYRYDPSGNSMEATGLYSSGDAPQFAVDGDGNLFVPDSTRHTIRRITPHGDATDIAGLPWYPGSADGLGTEANFNRPTAVALDGAGNLYVTDTGNHALRMGQLAGPPVISSQPSSITVAAGGAAQFAVNATSLLPLAYQWTFNGSPVPGATGTSLTISSVTTGSAGNYAVVVSNPLGRVTSNPATLSIESSGQAGSTGPGSGGGGAIPAWFVLTVLGLSIFRRSGIAVPPKR